MAVRSPRCRGSGHFGESPWGYLQGCWSCITVAGSPTRASPGSLCRRQYVLRESMDERAQSVVEQGENLVGCLELQSIYFLLQLGVVLGEILAIMVAARRVRCPQQALPALPRGDKALALTIVCLALLVLLLDILWCGSRDAELVALTNWLLMANHLAVASILIAQKCVGFLGRSSLCAGLCCVIGIAASSGTWSHPTQSWLFWAILGGGMGGYVGLRLLGRGCFRVRPPVRQSP